MKYKILLTGKNTAVMNDFFSQMDDAFEPLTTTLRYEDVLSHVYYVKPDAFCYCLFNETVDDIKKMSQIKATLEKYRVPVIIIGPEIDCTEFAKTTAWAADLMISTPAKAALITDKINKFIQNKGTTPEPAKVSDAEAGLEQESGSAPGRQNDSDFLAQMEQTFIIGSAADRRKHVLVVDDNAIMLKTIKEHLHDTYDVATAISGKIAMKFLEKKTTDLILLDYEMPDENGPAVLAKLRENPMTQNIPVIFLTGITERQKIAQALVLKPQGYLLKPIDHDKLIDAINKVLEG